ncbi:MAG: hypothetical protein MJZ39_03010 [Bacteroidales bacterium]|nr:hypothetical protein [Bacteroidales bacterium]
METGLSYFGARYYSSELSIWLSVDPMSDKYPSLSPYTYCANNPVKLVDPNGEEIGDFFDYSGNYLGTDGIDDGKIYITTQEDWTNCSQLENGMTLITIPQLGFSRKPSQVNLSDEAMLNIYQHYNNTDYSLKAMDRGVANKQDNGVNVGMMSDHAKKTIFVRIDGNINKKVTDNYYEIKNLFVHEKQHIDDYEKGVSVSNTASERRAITTQMNDSSYPMTRPAFQEAVKEYGRRNMMKCN